MDGHTLDDRHREDGSAPVPLRSPALRRRRRFPRNLRGPIYGAVLWIGLLYLLVHTIAVRGFGREALHAWLGEDLYNALIPAGGLALVVPLLLGLVALDVVFSALRALARWPLGPLLPRLQPVRRRFALHAGALVLLAIGVFAWPHVVTSSLGDHVINLTLRIARGGARAEDTVYAPGFSEWRFRRVEPGMTVAEVQALLGEPLDVRDWGGVPVARYTISPGSSHYWRREVIYDRQDRVTMTVGEFWFD